MNELLQNEKKKHLENNTQINNNSLEVLLNKNMCTCEMTKLLTALFRVT